MKITANILLLSKYLIKSATDFVVQSLETIENKILVSIQKCGRGTYAFAKDFLRFGDAKNISKALERLTNENIFIRIGREI